jgi:hypothetical protein
MFCRDNRPASRRRGSVLIEFAVVAFIFYMLLGAVISFGYLLYVAQGLQHTADLAAKEISRTPLSPTDTLENVLYGNANTQTDLSPVRQQIFDPHYLVLNVDPGSDFHGTMSFDALIASLPVVNQQLVPLMQSDEIGGVRYLRYPGGVFLDTDNTDDPTSPPPSGLLVAIPQVTSRGAGGVETIDWIPVVEEIDTQDASGAGANPDPFSITSPQRGIVALRFNYPVQSSAMSGFRESGGDPLAPNGTNVIAADDGSVTVVDEDGYSPPGTATASDDQFGPNAGTYGLGRQAALAEDVRPFRKLITAQAIYRREIFGN